MSYPRCSSCGDNSLGHWFIWPVEDIIDPLFKVPVKMGHMEPLCPDCRIALRADDVLARLHPETARLEIYRSYPSAR